MQRFLLFFLFGSISAGYSQTDIQNWQANHPDILLMNAASYNRLSPGVREQLKDKIAVYQDVPSLDELQKFSPSDEQKAIDLEQNEKGDQFIKLWLGTHQHVKIVPRSVYEQASPESRSAYETNNALILSGETITVADIQNYNP